MAGLHLSHQVGQGEVGVGTAHHINVVVVGKILLSTLRHTSHYSDEQAVFLLFHGVESIQTVPYLLLGVLTYGTGVQEYGIGLIDIVGGLVSCHAHDRCNNLAVGYVHLAAVSLNEQFLCALFHTDLCFGHKVTHFLS